MSHLPTSREQWLLIKEDSEWREVAALATTKQWIREMKRHFLIVSWQLPSLTNVNTPTPPPQPFRKVPRCLILHTFRQSSHHTSAALHRQGAICNLSLHLQHIQIVCSHIMCTVIGKGLQVHDPKDDAKRGSMALQARQKCQTGRSISLIQVHNWSTYSYDLEIPDQFKMNDPFFCTRKSMNQKDHSSHLKIKYSGEARVV